MTTMYQQACERYAACRDAVRSATEGLRRASEVYGAITHGGSSEGVAKAETGYLDAVDALGVAEIQLASARSMRAVAYVQALREQAGQR